MASMIASNIAEVIYITMHHCGSIYYIVRITLKVHLCCTTVFGGSLACKLNICAYRIASNYSQSYINAGSCLVARVLCIVTVK